MEVSVSGVLRLNRLGKKRKKTCTTPLGIMYSAILFTRDLLRLLVKGLHEGSRVLLQEPHVCPLSQRTGGWLVSEGPRFSRNLLTLCQNKGSNEESMGLEEEEEGVEEEEEEGPC